jgi:putative FmdB family regulatory protein
MPTFEFECQDCAFEFEELVMRSDEIIECPKCGGHDSKKLMSAFAVGGEARKAGGGCGPCKPAAGKCAGCKCG